VVQLLEVSDVVLENLTIEARAATPGSARPPVASICGAAPARSGGSPSATCTSSASTWDRGVEGHRGAPGVRQHPGRQRRLDPEFIETNLTWNDDGIRVPGTGHAVFHNTLTGFGDAMAVADRFVNVGVHFYRNDVRRTATTDSRRLRHAQPVVLRQSDPQLGDPGVVRPGVRRPRIRVPQHRDQHRARPVQAQQPQLRDADLQQHGGAHRGVQGRQGLGLGAVQQRPARRVAFRNNLLVYRGAGGLLAIESTGQDPIDFDHNACIRIARCGGPAAAVPSPASAMRARDCRPPGRCSGPPRSATTATSRAKSTRSRSTSNSVPTTAGRSSRRTRRSSPTARPARQGRGDPGDHRRLRGSGTDIGALISGREVPAWGDRNPRPKVAPEPAADAPKTDRLAPSGSPGSADSDTLPVSSSPGIIEPGGHG